MKNIHVLPTDKPSRLFIIEGKIFKYHKPQQGDDMKIINVNIYITSDEEIKEGDWFLDDNNQISHSYRLSHVKFANPKKIILTTDQDLIKDGVQAIDDEFLEWLVNNPSCELVNIRKVANGVKNHKLTYEYKIIIPKEESKQESLSWDELIREAGSEEQLIKILKLPHIAPLVREAMRSNCKNK